MGLPGWLLLAVDLTFLPVVAVVMARLVITAKRWRNLIFIPALLLFAAANLAMHLGVMKGNAELIRQAAYLAVLLITLMMTVVGGRVIAMFTANRLGRTKSEPIPLLEGVTLVSTAGVVLLQLAIMLGVAVPALDGRLVFIAERSQKVPSQPLITPLSPHEGQRHAMALSSGSMKLCISPIHGVLMGFLRHRTLGKIPSSSMSPLVSLTMAT